MDTSPTYYAIIDSAAVLTTFAYCMTILRVVLRRLKHEKLEPDDVVMVIALVFYTITTASYGIIVSVLEDRQTSETKWVEKLMETQLNNGTNIGVADPTALTPTQIQQGESIEDIGICANMLMGE